MEAVTITNETLNALKDAGIISDLCTCWDDVAEVDKAKALQWLAIGEDLI